MYNWLHILIRPVAQLKRENKKFNLHNIWNTSSVDAIDKMIQTRSPNPIPLKNNKNKQKLIREHGGVGEWDENFTVMGERGGGG